MMQKFIILSQLISTIYGLEQFSEKTINKHLYKKTYQLEFIPDDGSYLLSIQDINGNLFINGREGGEFRLEVLYKTNSFADKKNINQIKDDKINISHLEDDKIIQINTVSNPTHFDITKSYYIHLPSYIHLNIDIIGGDIYLSSINGTVNILTNGGNIDIDRLSGKINANTSAGDLNLKNIDGSIRLHTNNGDITVTKSSGNFYTSTSGGSLSFKYINGDIKAQNYAGPISLKDINSKSIIINNTGGLLLCQNIISNIKIKNYNNNTQLLDIVGNVDINSSNSDIYINHLSGQLNCQVTVGNIEGEQISGSIDAFSTVGDILMELNYNTQIDDYGIYLETNAGDITLKIPSRLSANIDAIIMKSNIIQNLNSDFLISTQITEEGVVGNGSIGLGTIPIKLRSTLGEINIEKE